MTTSGQFPLWDNIQKFETLQALENPDCIVKEEKDGSFKVIKSSPTFFQLFLRYIFHWKPENIRYETVKTAVEAFYKKDISPHLAQYTCDQLQSIIKTLEVLEKRWKIPYLEAACTEPMKVASDILKLGEFLEPGISESEIKAYEKPPQALDYALIHHVGKNGTQEGYQYARLISIDPDTHQTMYIVEEEGQLKKAQISTQFVHAINLTILN